MLLSRAALITLPDMLPAQRKFDVKRDAGGERRLLFGRLIFLDSISRHESHEASNFTSSALLLLVADCRLPDSREVTLNTA